MRELLCFLAGYIISGAVAIVLMSLMQINRLRESDELIRKLLKSSQDNGDPVGDDKR